MKRSFDWLMFGLTLVLSGIASLAYIAFADKLAWGSGFGTCLLVGGFFMIPFVLGLVGVVVAQWLRGRTRNIRYRGSRLISFLLATVGAFVFGTGMQALYMLDISGNKAAAETGPSDIMVLIDCSGSMDGCMGTCKEAAIALIEQMDAVNSAQLIPFCDVILDGGLDMTLMDDTGKSQMIACIEALQPNGGTSFDQALLTADAEFANSPSGNQNRAVIMITDCYGDVSAQIKDLYYNSKIPVYSVSIVDKGLIYEWMRAGYVDFIEKTGGFDVAIEKDASGNINLSELTDALTDAYSSIKLHVDTDEVIVFFGADQFTFFRALIRLITLIGYAVLTAYTYYQYFSVPSLIIHGVVGVASFALITVSGLIGSSLSLVIAFLLFTLLYWTAYTQYRKAASNPYGARKLR